MKIIFSGGGTLGPVIPLLAVKEAYQQKNPEAKFIWIGTKNGPERQIIEENKIPFIAIGTGKWRRYFSILNFFDVFRVVVAFFQSLVILWREKPHLLVSCGGYVSVPLHWAAALLAIPTWVHQQDVRVGLANKLMMPFAHKVTTALEETAKDLEKRKAEWIGNPSRDLTVSDIAAARERFHIPAGAQVIFALGGGTGSASINDLIIEALPQWPREWHIIHLVGRERPAAKAQGAEQIFENYHAYQFFTAEMKDAYAIADVVVARAGFSTLTELAAMAKAAVILPMFGTHQEDNARYFTEQRGIVMLTHAMATGLTLAQEVKELVLNQESRRALGARLHELLPRAKPDRLAEIIAELTK
ncbi:MAG: UDP-N-acetylglucosamine--N-acetylmuramyl-(pentapeptide) pyrophosphoryl-undecaprenol N-acetylglucosamine transferase [Candidatus Magasanikbacteria bacterium]|nr:UDP-N-acetylglucosamine--N-acetylmuramyl-(pentapeptide) pyrophosphoryl-undecaprenol N-acetylglucosamine transferase [Candidatus Magasanikbacteria bacterium]